MRSSLRLLTGLGLGLVLAGVIAQPAAAAAGSPDQVLELSLAVDQAAAADIPIELTVTNRGGTPCEIAATALGTVRVTEVVRDGKALQPVFGEARYLVPLSQQISESTRTLAPGGHTTIIMAVAKHDNDFVLSTVDGLPSGSAITSNWFLAPGRYTISALYSTPQWIGQPPCRGVSQTATVEFTVGAAATPSSTLRWWWIAATAGGLLVLAALLWLLLRRRHARRAALAAVLVLAGVASAPAVGRRPAYAEVSVAGQPGEFLGTGVALARCMGIFRSPGGDPAKIIPDVDKPEVHIKVRPRKPGDYTDSYDHANGKQVVYWDHEDTKTMLDKGGLFGDEKREPGTLTDPCAELYHELAHASEFNRTGKTDKRPCGNLTIETTEAAATLAENQYRAGRKPKLDQRQSYGPHMLPKSMKDCENRPPEQKKQSSACTPATAAASAPTGCDKDLPPEPDNGRPAMSNGDPHLITFDGRHYDFQAVGEFVAVESATGDLVVQTRQSPVRGSRSVSVNSAAAFKIGPDRLRLAVADGDLALWVNGRPERWERGARSLPGGGKAARRPSPIWSNQDGYTIRWPDGSLAWVDPIGPFGLRLYVLLADARKGTVHGLLGDFDGNADNDLRPRGGGEPLKELTHEALYGGFGNGWRITMAESLFGYDSGQNIETFTDRGFPDKVVGVAQLDAAQRDSARAVCEDLGITDAVQLEACVLDVALTGQAAFAVNSLDIQTNPVLVRPSTPTGPSGPGGAVRDGDRIGDEIRAAQEVRRYTLDLGGAADFFVADWHGLSDACDQAFFVNLVNVSHGNQPCTGGAVAFHVPDPAKTYQLEIVSKPGQAGKFSFQLVTVKPRAFRAAIGDRITGSIEVRGREDRHEFEAAGAAQVRLTELTTDCTTELLANLWDVTENRVIASGRLLCGDVRFALDNPAHRYAIAVVANNVGTGRYGFTLQRG